MRTLMIVTVLLAVCGCSKTADVLGGFEDGSETFKGTTTGYLDGAGVLSIVSSKGLRCEGQWVFVTKRTGKGTFNCADGQNGPFEFVSTGSRGTGTGRLGGKPFVFSFG